MSELPNITPHAHCDNDPIECWVEAMQGEYEERGRKIARLQRSILIQNEQHIFDLDRIDALREHVKEFRQKCDPKEEIVLVTAEEMGL